MTAPRKWLDREPTPSMVRHGVNTLSVTGGNAWEDAAEMWRAMFDDAAPDDQPAAEDARITVAAENAPLVSGSTGNAADPIAEQAREIESWKIQARLANEGRDRLREELWHMKRTYMAAAYPKMTAAEIDAALAREKK